MLFACREVGGYIIASANVDLDAEENLNQGWPTLILTLYCTDLFVTDLTYIQCSNTVV
jgi:hypothetical protein